MPLDKATRFLSVKVAGLPENDDVGQINIRLIATDSSGASASTIFSITIDNTNRSPDDILSEILDLIVERSNERN